MANKTALSTASDTYPQLVSQFRLVPIKDDNHLETILFGSLLGGTILENRDKALTRNWPAP
jgi:hypothetical protein